MNRFQALATLCLLSLGESTLHADLRVDLLGQWGGGIHAASVHDGLAYVGIGPRIVILDLQDPSQPVRIGQTEPLGHVVNDIAVDGAFAYVAAHDAGLKIIDVTDPAAPHLVGSHTFPDRALAVGKAGNHAFVFCRDSGLHVLDVSDSTAPQPIGQYMVGGSVPYGMDMSVQDGVAYLLTWARLTLVDISAPSDPSFLGGLPLGWCTEIEVEGAYAYIAEDALAIVDVSDRLAPALVARIEDEVWTEGWRVALGSGRAYLGEDSPGMTVIDTTDPTQPLWRGATPADSTLGGALAASGTQVLLGDWYSGVRIVDAANPDQPVEVGLYEEVAHSHFLSTAGNLLLACGYRPGVQVIDITNPHAPQRVAEWGDRRMMHAELRGTTAYLGDGGLTILDASELTAPKPLGRLHLGDTVSGVFAIDGQHVFMGTYGGGLRVINISDPTAPQLLTTVGNAPAYGVVVRGQHAYVATYDHGLQVFDISRLDAPQLLGQANETGAIYCVTLLGDVAYVGGNQGVHVVDVSDPTAPQVLPISLPGYWGQVWSLCAQGAYVLVALEPGMRVLDASNAREPRLVATYADQGWGEGVAAADGLAFLGTGEGGVEVLVIRPPGDLDGDDRVTIGDLGLLLTAFGTGANEADFLTTADLDSDGCITINDLHQLLSRFGS